MSQENKCVCDMQQKSASSFLVGTFFLVAAAGCCCYYYYHSNGFDENPLDIALPHQGPVKFVLVTALYNLHRKDRSFRGSYLPWFQRTIRKMSGAASQTVVFCNDRLVADLARGAAAAAAGKIIVVLEEDYPLSHMRASVQPILQKKGGAGDDGGWHPEWMNEDYILLQFSKFVWLQSSSWWRYSWYSRREFWGLING